MSNDKSRFLLLRSLVILVVLEELVQFGKHRVIGSVVDVAFLVDKTKDSIRLALEQLNTLCIVCVLNVRP